MANLVLGYIKYVMIILTKHIFLLIKKGNVKLLVSEFLGNVCENLIGA